MNTKVRPNTYTSFRDYDIQALEHQSYRNNVTDPTKSKDIDFPTDVERVFFVVTSLSRDKSIYPDAASFRVTLPEEYTEVLSVELSAGVIPNKGGIIQDGYVLL